jgi:hypothetical protein
MEKLRLVQALGKGTASEAAEKSRICAVPWKSGASAPRQSPGSARASAPVVAFCVYKKFFRNLFSRAAKALKNECAL